MIPPLASAIPPLPSAVQQKAVVEDASVSLVVEEYKSCRELIKLNIDIIEKSEIYAIGAVAATSVYCLTLTSELVQRAACCVPFFISIAGSFRFYGIDSTIEKINNYLEIVESKYLYIGWTKSYRAQNRKRTLKWSRYAIWIILVLYSILFGVYVFYNAPLIPSAQATVASQASSPPATAPFQVTAPSVPQAPGATATLPSKKSN
jgi:hypothetical protein